MSKTKNRVLFSFSVTHEEKKEIDRRSQVNGMTRSEYVRFKTFQPDELVLSNDRNRLTNRAVPEVNVKTYRTLREISDKLERISSRVNSHNPISFSQVNVDKELLAETLRQLETIGYKLAIASAKF